MQAIRTLIRKCAPMMLALHLIMLATLVATPAGYMPAAGVDGVHFILCSGQTPPAGAPGIPPNRSNSPESDCPFALANTSSIAPPPALPLLNAPQLIRAIPRPWPAPAATSPEIPTRSQHATGPPNAI